jgi:methionyl-tRNA formyltransferase
MTDVPYGRGGSPLQNLIVRGHKATKLSALRMTAEMDAGPVYTKRTLSLEGTAHEIYLKAGELSYEIMVWMIDNNPQPIEQVGEPVIFHRRKPKDSMLPVGIEIPEIYDFIRMLDAPTYPHAFIEHGDFIIEFTDASIDCNELVANIRLRKKDQN